MNVLRYMKLYRPTVRRYIWRQVDAAALHWNAGLTTPEIAVAIDCSDALTSDLLNKAVMAGKLRKVVDNDRLPTLKYA